ncbi:MAG: beta-ketoacyl-ACP synthase 3 [Candidatus Aminicenantes bacterium]|nr:MAG: beta-ketoacyl-ACP synthase 3 [Candidatus Aminicenantes bacterium]
MSKCAKIVGTGSYLPKQKISNEKIENMVSNFDPERAAMPFTQWVEKVTGIKTRCFVESEDTEMMAAEASQKALEAAGMKAANLDFIVASSFTPTRDIPNLACTVGHMIGADGVGGFPLNTACAGFVYALAVAYALIRSEIYSNILVVSSETLSRVVDFGDPSTAVLFADGAGAAVLQASDEGGICSSPCLISDYSDHIYIKNADAAPPQERIKSQGKEYVPRDMIHMPGGPHVLKRAVNGMAEVLHKALDLSPYELEDLDVIIPHQANLRIADGLIKKLGVPEEKVCRVIHSIGNTSGASVAISLDMAIRGEVDNLKINPGDLVGLTAIAGGYSAGAIVFEY